MPPGRAVTDTSPLLNLAFTDRLHLLDQQFSTVLVPDAVLDEIREGEEGAEVVLDLVDTGLLATVEVARDDLFEELARELDHGEAAVIRHAIDAGIDRVIIDEREGRAAARRHDLRPTGVVGILMKAYDDTSAFRDALDELRVEGFWMSDELYDDVLDRHQEL